MSTELTNAVSALSVNDSGNKLRPDAPVYIPPSQRKHEGELKESKPAKENGQSNHKGSKQSREANPPAKKDKQGWDPRSQNAKHGKEQKPSKKDDPRPASVKAPSESKNNAKNDRKNKEKTKRKPKNTETFEPCYDPADMRVVVGNGRAEKFGKKYGVHDVAMVPEMFCDEDDLTVYEGLIKELQDAGKEELWVYWHGDSHVIADDRRMGGKWKKLSPSFQKVITRMAEYFDMDIKATRFNWYKDSTHWKPYHHDRAAFTPGCPQNITVAASFGDCRDACFQHAKTYSTVNFPQPNGCAYAFGSQVNIDWRHGILPVHPDNHHNRGRISIIAWGWVDMEEDKAPTTPKAPSTPNTSATTA